MNRGSASIPAPILQRGRRPRTSAHPHPRNRAQEAFIAAAYDTIDRALKRHKAGSRRLSLLILLAGIVAVALAIWYSPDRRRQRLAAGLPAQSDTTAVLRALGPRPTRCPPGAMEHVQPELGVPDVEGDSIMAQLRRGTRQRWIYPGTHGCTPEKGETELGIDAAGRMLWIQPGAQKGDVRLSPAITY